MANEFFDHYRAGFNLFTPFIAQREQAGDRAESSRRFDVQVGMRQKDSDREFQLGQERNKRLDTYYSTLEKEAEMRRRVQEDELNRRKAQLETAAQHRSRLAEVEKALLEKSRSPGGTDYAETVAELMYQHSDLAVSEDPYVRQRAAELSKLAQQRIMVGMSAEEARDKVLAAKRGISVEDLKRERLMATAAESGYAKLDEAKAIPALPTGELDPVEAAKFRNRVEVDKRAREDARLNDKGSYVETYLGYDENNRPTGKARFSPEDALRQGINITGSQQVDNSAKELAALRKLKVDLDALKARGVTEVANGDFNKGVIAEDRLSSMGLKIDSALADVESRIRAYSGGQPAAPAQAPAKQPAPAEGRVRVVSPDGTPGSIPANQLDQALANGFRVIQ